MAHPTKKGQKYKSGNKQFTVKGFHSRDGVSYDTYYECRKNASDKDFICVVNVEHGGSSVLNLCTLTP